MLTARIVGASGDRLADIRAQPDAVVENILHSVDLAIGKVTAAAAVAGEEEQLNQALALGDLPQKNGVVEIMTVHDEPAITDVVKTPGFTAVSLKGGCATLVRKYSFFLNTGTILSYFACEYRGPGVRAWQVVFGLFCVMGDSASFNRVECRDGALTGCQRLFRDRRPGVCAQGRIERGLPYTGFMPALYAVGTTLQEKQLIVGYFTNRLELIVSNTDLEAPTAAAQVCRDIDRVFMAPVMGATPAADEAKYRKVFSKTPLNRHFLRLDPGSDDAMRTAFARPRLADTEPSHWHVTKKRGMRSGEGISRGKKQTKARKRRRRRKHKRTRKTAKC